MNDPYEILEESRSRIEDPKEALAILDRLDDLLDEEDPAEWDFDLLFDIAETYHHLGSKSAGHYLNLCEENIMMDDEAAKVAEALINWEGDLPSADRILNHAVEINGHTVPLARARLVWAEANDTRN
jgi:hypothetical protein